MKTLNTIAIALLMLFSATGFSQEKTEYVQEGDVIKVVRYYEGTEDVRETGYFKDGVSHGRWVEYDRNGNIKIEAFYRNGKKEGTWFVFTEDGKGLYQLTYQDNYLKNSHKWSIEERDLLADN